MTPTELLKLAREIRDVNAVNGRSVLAESDWDDYEKVLSKLALIHARISKYYLASSASNALEELADVQISVLDAMNVATDLEIVNAFKNVYVDDFSRGVIVGKSRSGFVCELGWRISEAMEPCDDADPKEEFLNFLADVVNQINMRCGGAIYDKTVRFQIAKDRERGHRRGGKRL